MGVYDPNVTNDFLDHKALFQDLKRHRDSMHDR